MAKIYFEGVAYENADEMPADVRARYDKAVEMLPDRDANGVPDLLETDYTPGGSKPFRESSPGRPDHPGIALPESGRPSPPVLDEKAAQRARKTFRLAGWGIFGLVILCFGCVVAIFAVVFALMRSSGAYQLAIQEARSNPIATEALGTPINEGLFISGSTSENGAEGEADLAIPVKGSQRSGTLYVHAIKQDSAWILQTLILDVEGQEYDLLR